MLSPDDAAHEAAILAARTQRQIFTITWVLTELADGLADSPWRGLFKPFLERLQSDRNVIILPATQEQFDRGAELYSARGDKEWSLTDCISFAVMSEYKIEEALTGDHHFEQAGFAALLK